MTKMIKGILINAKDRTVKPVEVRQHDIHHMHDLIECQCFTCLNMNEKGTETIYVDDEGLLKDPKHFFRMPFYPQWLAGNGLILGTNSNGESVNTKCSVEEIESQVKFGAIA